MAEIIENYSELMPEWANESLEENLDEVVDEFDGQQKQENTQRRFMNNI